MVKKKYEIRKDPGVALNPGERVLTEDATRRRLLNAARFYGFEMEVKEILERTDRLLQGCTNEQERKMIAIYGNMEIHKLMGAHRELIVDGKKVM